ncbi:PDZ domain-containing protein [Rubritalea sp.]|uniref:PDZ domain-containing protein n=1 Tax=Rubritalea sp. TaxID=2109375 RepID=UPI003EF30DB1
MNNKFLIDSSMRNGLLAVGILALSLVGASAQNHDLAKVGLPFVRISDAAVLVKQSDAFYKAIEPLSKEAGQHAVNVYSSGRMVARGTVTEHGVLTKWSELVSKGSNIQVVGYDGIQRDSYVKSVYLEYDLALLDYGGGLPAVDFLKVSEDHVGDFIFAVGPAKDAHGFGVVSVAPRSLRETDKAYLGVRMDFNPVNDGGVRLESVERGAPAAHAGLVSGDIITTVNDEKVDGVYELGIVLQRMKPGELVNLSIIRGENVYRTEVVLGARSDEMKQFSPERMKQMKRMGGAINEVAEGFPEVLQSDMQVRAIDAGGPVFDIDGNFVGLIAARASRIKTYIIPPHKLLEQLEKQPDMTASVNKLDQRQKKLDQRQQVGRADDAEETEQLRKIITQAQERILELEQSE